MSAGIPEAFFHRKSLETGEICNFAFYKQMFYVEELPLLCCTASF